MPGPIRTLAQVPLRSGPPPSVQPGIVNAIMEVIKAVAEYPREGNLYLADLALTSFVGQGSGR